MSACPVPNCTDPVPSGRFAIFCVEHHCQLPYKTTSKLFRLQMKGERALDETHRQHMREQLPGYIAQAVREISAETAGPRVSSQAAPAGVRQTSLMMTDAATYRQARS